MKLPVCIIDIGSNSVRMMTVTGEVYSPVFSCKKLSTTRLAEGINKTGLLSGAAMKRSVEAIAAFSNEAGDMPAYAYATSATRDAGNRDVLLRLVKERTGIDIDVISGETEARLAYLGAGSPGALIDIGGGSTQIVTDSDAVSWPMGCVRAKELTEQLMGAGNADLRERFDRALAAIYRFPRIRIEGYRGAGGTITTLAALSIGLSDYDRTAVSSAVLTQESVERLIAMLADMGERRKCHPLLRERHDVIIPGAMVLSFVMRGAGIYELRATDADGMEGYFYGLRDGLI